MSRYLECPCEGCENEREAGHAMCRSCWYLVPKAMRDEVWRTYRAHGACADESVEARERALVFADAALANAAV